MATKKKAKVEVVNDITAFLNEVDGLVNSSRATDYGDKDESFGRIAKLWSIILDTEITPKQVAVMMVLLKVSRLATTMDHRDSWLDIAGYASLGANLSNEEEDE